MVFIKDLEKYNCLSGDDDSFIAIGWLSGDDEFTRGEVSEVFFNKLVMLCDSPLQPVFSPGVHFCELCQFDGPGFSGNIFIPYKNEIYVAPVAIVHYINAHWYCPPDIFIQAVIECPKMNSMEYKKALLTNGGKGLF